MKIKNITRIISIFSFIFFIALVSGNNASAHTNAKMEEKWEKIKYAYLPNLSDLKWVELGEEYLLVRQNVTYKVLDASKQETFIEITTEIVYNKSKVVSESNGG